jgi:hypothetical protein
MLILTVDTLLCNADTDCRRVPVQFCMFSFLRNLGLLGPGIDCRISAFFAPLGGKISEAVVRELDKGAVELVSHTEEQCGGRSSAIVISLSFTALLHPPQRNYKRSFTEVKYVGGICEIVLLCLC